MESTCSVGGGVSADKLLRLPSLLVCVPLATYSCLSDCRATERSLQHKLIGIPAYMLRYDQGLLGQVTALACYVIEQGDHPHYSTYFLTITPVSPAFPERWQTTNMAWVGSDKRHHRSRGRAAKGTIATPRQLPVATFSYGCVDMILEWILSDKAANFAHGGA